MAEGRKLTTWHRWFAWHPVRVGHKDCRWLEYVERKGRCPNLSYDDKEIAKGFEPFMVEIWGFRWEWKYRPAQQSYAFKP